MLFYFLMVEAAGIEPERRSGTGRQIQYTVRAGSPQYARTPHNSAHSIGISTHIKNVPEEYRIPDDVRLIVDAWGDLPAHAKSAIVAMVGSARKGSSADPEPEPLQDWHLVVLALNQSVDAMKATATGLISQPRYQQDHLPEWVCSYEGWNEKHAFVCFRTGHLQERPAHRIRRPLSSLITIAGRLGSASELMPAGQAGRSPIGTYSLRS